MNIWRELLEGRKLFFSVEETREVLEACGIRISLWQIRQLVRNGTLHQFAGGRYKPAGTPSRWRILVPRESVESFVRTISWAGSFRSWKRYYCDREGPTWHGVA